MARTTVKLRGKERIQQLMEEFPEIPRSLVVKEDMQNLGIRKTDAARRLGRWALPEAPWYFDYNKEDTHSAEEIGNGYWLSPLVGHFTNGICWQFLWDSGSPYEVRYEGAGRYWLYRDDDPIEEVLIPPRPEWMDLKTSSGHPMSAIGSQRGEDELTIAILQYCEFFKSDDGCLYCNIVQSEATRKAQGLERVAAKRDQDIYETVLAAAKGGYVHHVTLSGGVILDVEKEATMYARIAKVVKRALTDAGKKLGEDCNIMVAMQAPEQAHSVMLKEAGITQAAYSLEVWDPRLFKIICPGKSKYVGREKWMERMVAAVPIFGRFAVASTIVAGAELVHPEGFKTEEEGIESNVEFWKWGNEHGILTTPLGLRPGPGTAFEGMTPPRTEYLLRLELAFYKLAVEHNRVPKPGGQPYRNCIPAILGDIAVLGLRQAQAASPAESNS